MYTYIYIMYIPKCIYISCIYIFDEDVIKQNKPLALPQSLRDSPRFGCQKKQRKKEIRRNILSYPKFCGGLNAVEGGGTMYILRIYSYSSIL